MKITKQRIHGGKRITSYETKSVQIKIDNKLYKKGFRQFSISTHGLVFVHYQDGRTYFDVKDFPISFDDVTHSLSFVYKGEWEVETPKFKILKVKKKFIIKFDKPKEFEKIKEIILKLRQRKNPMPRTQENIRRWLYLNLPKYGKHYVSEYDINLKLKQYFGNLTEDDITYVNTILRFWYKINMMKYSENELKIIWRYYMIEHPDEIITDAAEDNFLVLMKFIKIIQGRI